MILWILLWSSAAMAAPSSYHDIDEPPHSYAQRVPRDRFTKLKSAFESGSIQLDKSSEKAFLTSVLKALDVPVTSQMLVFSTTSLQLSLISPTNPRALYFNEDTYVGYVPGGRIEIVSIDPELGGIFYIFDIPSEGQSIRVERSSRCMNCHSGEESGFVPGLVIKSVVPGPRGGSLTAYRSGQTGHAVPLEERFGGWHLTGHHNLTNHWGNLTGRLVEGKLITVPNAPGERFSFEKYPVATSDVLPQLLHEHQAGFVNRVVEAAYRARTALHAGKGKLSPEQSLELDQQAAIIVGYLLFADEASLPSGGIKGDEAYVADFLRARRASPGGIALKDLDLRQRLFKHRCSYMIYSSLFTSLPSPLKDRVYAQLRAALSSDSKEFAYLPSAEKKAIASILKATIPELPRGW